MAKQADGTYKSHSRYRFPQAPDYVYEYDDISFKKADLSCSVVKTETQKTARFFRMGDEVLFEDLEQLRAFAAAALKPLEGKELCQKTKAIDAATGVIEFELNLDGQALPANQQANSKLIWVDPKDGYKLR